MYLKKIQSVQQLQTTIADYFGKECALFFPSGTMSNLTAILSWCNKRGSEIIVGNNSHIFYLNKEVQQFGGVAFHTVQNMEDGTMILEDIENAIRDDDIHEPTTELIAIENTHNACGGKVLPKDFFVHLRELVRLEHNLPIHLDGARIWNALQESEMTPIEMAYYVDSMSVLFIKGLGAPIGSLLVGSKELISKAKRIRKALGGGMRQSGIVATAG